MSPRGEKLNMQIRAEAIAKITRAALKVFAEYGYYDCLEVICKKDKKKFITTKQ